MNPDQISSMLQAQNMPEDIAKIFAQGVSMLPLKGLKVEINDQPCLVQGFSLDLNTQYNIIDTKPMLRFCFHGHSGTKVALGFPPLIQIVEGDRRAFREAIEELSWAASTTPAFHVMRITPSHVQIHLIDGTHSDDGVTNRTRIVVAAGPGGAIFSSGIKQSESLDPRSFMSNIYDLISEGDTTASLPELSAHDRLKAPWRQDLISLLGKRGEAPVDNYSKSEHIILRKHGCMLAIIARHFSMSAKNRLREEVDGRSIDTANDHLLALWSAP